MWVGERVVWHVDLTIQFLVELAKDWSLYMHLCIKVGQLGRPE